MKLNKLLNKLISRNDLTSKEANFLFNNITSGKLSDIQISAFLVALSSKTETVTEIISAVKVLKRKSLKINYNKPLLDTCGTGGDEKDTLNISTATAILTAACGVKVAKHGNKAVSSKSGSSEVLAELGVNINANTKKVIDCLKKAGICFLMAPIYHSAMKNVVNVRANLKVKTIFNLLGPLLNPANADRQLIGVYSKKWLMPVAECLKKLPIKKAWVVHGKDGLDEISISANTYVAEVKNNRIRKFVIDPEVLGIKKVPIVNIKGRDSKFNAKAIIALFSKKKYNTFFKNIVLINTAAALVVADKAQNLKDGLKIANMYLEDGSALNKLIEFRRLTK